MSECIDRQQQIVSSMTGSTRAGPVQPREEEPTVSGSIKSTDEDKHRLRRRMTPVPLQSEQPIQLTPLWEHVVRTQQFPPDVDTCSTFAEISTRLRDPEWEVRQHALRVLIDVLPTLDGEHVDEIVQPIVAELINNLGHLAPAVRKGALDALRVYLQCSGARDEVVRNILHEGLNYQDAGDPFQTNISLGVILSTPSLLFPSSSSARPSKQSLKMVIIALAERLGQVTHQEAALRSLVKIRDTIGAEDFDSYLSECGNSVKRDFEVLCQAYKLYQRPRKTKKMKRSMRKKLEIDEIKEGSDARHNGSEISTIKDDDDDLQGSTIPPSRVVLETEIKFNEATAITMTILEEKDEDSDGESSEDSLKEDEEAEVEEDRLRELKDEPKDAWIERRKTPKRVHFGGEIVKLRTPDSDGSETVPVEVPQTRIPVPISPVTKMPVFRPGRSRSNPCSPNMPRWKVTRRARSASNTPKRDFYVHDGSLSPKKSILSKNNSQFVDKFVDKNFRNRENDVFGMRESDRSWSFEVFKDIDDSILEKEKNLFIEKTRKTKKTKRSPKVNSAGGQSLNEGTEVQEDSNKLEDSQENINEIHFMEVPEVKVQSPHSSNSSLNVANELKNLVDGVNEDVSKVASNKSEKNLENRVKKPTDDLAEEEKTEINETERRSNVESGSSKKSEDKTRSPRRKLVFESFPRQERNYILMELSSPVKGNSRSREVSPQGIQSSEHSQESKTSPDPAHSSELSDPRTLNELSIERTSPMKAEASSLTIVKEEIHEQIKEESKSSNVKTSTKKQENSGTRTGSSSDGEVKIQEPSWEELGLVDEDVLNDLHNKEDWRARVRGLERVASALRTSSALVAIEPRLGSLLHAVLGCERSCRVAAAGMAVARVVVAGVSEEALKRRLPQIAWGLTRQGGPNAAQIARIAMLRLRPALFLEQLLQPHCIDARNAKTRENALQLLIFSLVTFPSTEFRVENVANKVALMVGDRRRRVRQAALDTLAVLAQIYEPEEVLQAGQRAAKQLKEGSDMVAAIRARLARKSLPMVSADGLVVYGLQISPTVQIATGPDVDWIVAGSGSVSPGTGRSRGQIIPMNGKTGLEKNSSIKGSSRRNSAMVERNFVAVGVGLHPKSERPVAWQLVPPSSKSESNLLSHGIEKEYRNNSPIVIGIKSSNKTRLEDNHRPFNSPVDQIEDTYDTEATVNVSLLQNDKDVIMKQRKTEENFHRRMDEIYSETSHEIVRLESRIPVPQYRDRDIIVRHSTAYQRRRRPIQEENYYQTSSSSAPQTSAGLHDPEVQRRYRSDRIKRQSRPGSEDRGSRVSPKTSPTRDSFIPAYRNRRRKSTVQTTNLEPEEPLNAARIDSRRVGSSALGLKSQKTFGDIQTVDSRSKRISSTPTVLNGEKSTQEEEYNERNRRHVSAQANTYGIQNPNDQASQCFGRDREAYEVSSDSSNERDNELRAQEFNEDHMRIASPTKSFDVITHESNPSRRNSIDQVAVNVLSSTTTDSTDLEKESSSDDVASGREIDSDDPPAVDPPSGSSVISNESNSMDEVEREVMSPLRSSGIKVVAFDEADGPDISLAFDRGYSTELQIDIESRVRASIYPEPKAFFQPPDVQEAQQDELEKEEEEENEDDDEEVEKTEAVNSVSIVVASRPHSRAAAEYREAAFQPLAIRQPHRDTETSASGSVIHDLSPLRPSDHEDISVTNEIVSVSEKSLDELPGDTEIRVVTIGKLHRASSISRENGIAPEVVETQFQVRTNDVETTKRLQSRMPRSRVKARTGFNKISPAAGHHSEKTSSRSKPITPQCFTQLESNDWEVTVKGLKALSAIARQHPEQLDTCPPGIIGRLLGRHIRNLRSQVSRTACLAAGDLFETEARCIDQDLDDIAGPLLHRTADTNKFLRADSNAALDGMIEHLPLHRTISVIVNRGASHQNAIVRAATARLLCSIVDRFGPDLAMSLPRDVREKLLGSGARLLMDGNLDARNHAKKMFKRLSRCEGFRKALTDCVPDTTLRHIEKTLRSL